MVTNGHSPILFMDIDGVLNPFAGPCPHGFVEIDLLPGDDKPVRICATHGDWLAELAESFDLVWATAWDEEERRLLRTVLDHPDFVAAAAMPPKPFHPRRKVEIIGNFASNRSAAWIDDMMTDEAWAWASARLEPTLLLEADPAVGLTRRQVDELIEWASRLPGSSHTTRSESPSLLVNESEQ